MTTEERLERLEKELKRATRFNRWLLTGAILTLGVCALGWSVAARPAAKGEEAETKNVGHAESGQRSAGRGVWTTAPARMPGTEDLGTAGRVIRAECFIVEDGNGKVRAALGMNKDGPVLHLFGDNGELRAAMCVEKDVPALSLCDENGKPRVMMGVTRDESSLVLADANGKDRAGLGVTKDGPCLEMRDANGKVRAGLGLIKDGPCLEMLDANGETRAMLGMYSESPALLLRDGNGKNRAALSVDKDGPGLHLSDASARLRAALGVTGMTTFDGKIISYPESSLLLSGPDGKLIWHAP